ncbi:5123_t:CDS:10, partial [Diversispora eburnea]
MANTLEVYGKGTSVWFPDEHEGWKSAQLVSKEETGGNVKLTFLSENGKEIVIATTIDKLQKSNHAELPPLRNPPLLEASDDLTSLSYLNEPAVLIAANPFSPVSLYSQDIINAYSGKRRGELEPHVFAIAEDAYRCMLREKNNQTIVVSGESGAGKTASAKFIMRYFASVDDKEKPLNSKKAVANSGMSEVEEQIMATNPIMESFGNAKTTRNDNSSRFGKYLEIQFDKDQNIIGAKIRTYLLERSRLVYQPENERNYHIFYQLCAGAPPSEKKSLELDEDYRKFYYLRQGGVGTIPGVNDAQEFELTRKALSTIGIEIQVQWHIFRICAALLHIGNIKITATRNGSIISESDPSLITATKLLGINLSDFRQWIVKKRIVVGREKIVTELDMASATVVRDSVAKYIYANLFDWLVSVTNESLSGEEITRNTQNFIGVLDIYGFEHFKKNSFEQFCINYANEKLQQQFNQHVFKLEQEEYVREKINWTFIDFSDNQPCIDLIEGKLGILSILDEESRRPGSTDETWCNKLYDNFNKQDYKQFFKKPRFSNVAFTISHYAHDVTYEVENFLEKNKDTVPEEHLTLLRNTEFEFLDEILNKVPQAASPTTKSDSKRASMSVKKPTLGSIFKVSLINLMETINSTNVHYIRCIKPNEVKIAWVFEPQMVLGQLRACGVLETIRISCAGYPSRWTFDEFLAYLEKLRLDRLNECVTLMQKNMLRHMYQKRWAIIKSSTVKVQNLIRSRQAKRRLKRLRENNAAVTIQKYWRGYIQQKKYNKDKKSVYKIQLAVRSVIARNKFQILRRNAAAIKIQSVYRGWLVRKEYKKTLKLIVFMQSCLRRRLARAELKKLKMEARSVSHFQEKSYKLEKMIIELTQNFERETQENKLLKEKISTLETHIKSWSEKNGILEAENKQIKNEAKTSTASTDELNNLRKEKETLESRYRSSLESIKKQDTEIQNLVAEVSKKDDEISRLRASAAKWKGAEDPANVLQLKQEIITLKEQLTKTMSSSSNATPPTSHRQVQENGYLTTKNQATLKPPAPKRKPRRHSSVESWGPNEVVKRKPKTSMDLVMAEAKSKPGVLRPASASYVQNIPKIIRAPGGRILPGVDEPEEEIMKILEDDDSLDDEVINRLIKDLKIPLPSLQNPPSAKEILFPSRLISLLARQMWRFGFIKESERLFANVMKTIQEHVMEFEGDDAVLPGAFWLSNVHELLSFSNSAEKDMLRGVNPAADSSGKNFEWRDYERLVSIVKHDLESLEYNIYHTWMKELKKRLYKMVIPSVIESQSLPGFITNESNRFIAKFITGPTTPAFSMDDLLNFLNKVWKAMKSYYVEMSVIQQVITELLKLIGVTSFNDLLMRRNFCSWKRAMQIQYNMTRIEEWCKSHEMPEGTLQLEHLMQATKLLQLKKATLGDIEIIYDVCWLLTPTQIQKLISHYFVADYENPISPEILKAVASRVSASNNKSDSLLLDTTPLEDSGPFEVPLPREVHPPENYVPSWLNLIHIKRLGSLAIKTGENHASVEEGITQEDMLNSVIETSNIFREVEFPGYYDKLKKIWSIREAGSNYFVIDLKNKEVLKEIDFGRRKQYISMKALEYMTLFDKIIDDYLRDDDDDIVEKKFIEIKDEAISKMEKVVYSLDGLTKRFNYLSHTLPIPAEQYEGFLYPDIHIIRSISSHLSTIIRMDGIVKNITERSWTAHIWPKQIPLFVLEVSGEPSNPDPDKFKDDRQKLMKEGVFALNKFIIRTGLPTYEVCKTLGVFLAHDL